MVKTVIYKLLYCKDNKALNGINDYSTRKNNFSINDF